MQSLLDNFLMKLNIDSVSTDFKYNGEIFHYTSSHNLNSILLNPSGNICLWASRHDCLNDSSEGKVVLERYREVCSQLRSEQLVPKELYDILIDIRPSRNETFLGIKNNSVKASRYEFDSYVTSFSQNNDLLAMWNYYSKGTMYEGLNIGLDSQTVLDFLKDQYPGEKCSIQVVEIIYKKQDQTKIIRDVLLDVIQKYQHGDETSVRAFLSMKLTSWKLIFKNECFEHEKEVRIIFNISKKHSNDFKINYRTYAGYIIPYIELPICKEALRSVTLGPLSGDESQKDLQKQILREILTKNNYNAEAKCSTIPVRY